MKNFHSRWWAAAQVKVLCFLLLLVASLAQGADAADEPIALEAYWQLVEETQGLVRELQANPEQAVQPSLAEMGERWQGVTAVLLPDGTVTPVDHSFLVGQLRAESPNLGRLGNYLGVLLVARETWPDAKHGAADSESLRAILERPEFQWETPEPSRLRQLLDRLIRRIMELLFGDGESGGGGQGGEVLVNVPFTIIGAVILLAVLLYAMRGLLGELVTEAELEAAAETGDEALSAQGALKRAQRLSGEGDYRTAVRYLYLSSLLLLEERGLLRYDRSLTNREYLRSMRNHPELAGTLREVIEVFDRVWYGFEELDAAEYRRYEEQVNGLRRGGVMRTED